MRNGDDTDGPPGRFISFIQIPLHAFLHSVFDYVNQRFPYCLNYNVVTATYRLRHSVWNEKQKK
jgi:hypothetical protein